jgi:hypothetical protein
MHPMSALDRAATCFVVEDAGLQAAVHPMIEPQCRLDLDFDGSAAGAKPRVACITH